MIKSVVAVAPAAMGRDPIHQRGPGRTADRSRTVGMEEGRRLRGQGIEVRSVGLGVTSEVTDPVIQIIHGDEEDIGLFRGYPGRSGFGPASHPQGEKDQQDKENPERDGEYHV